MIVRIADVLQDSNLFEGWAKVKANKGCAGIDGQTLGMFEQQLMRNLSTLQNEVQYETYHPHPLLRITVDKRDGSGKRPLSIPVVRDRVLQTAVARTLTPLFEAEFEDCSFAYRSGRSVNQAVRRVMQLRNEGFCWVVDADIRSFFDEINHDLMISEVKKLVKDPAIVNLIRLWLKMQVVDGKQRFRLKKGVPQGSPISPMLSNLYLDHLDESLLNKKIRLVRFADDFLVLCKSQTHAENALELTSEVLETLHLELNEEKTRVVDFNRGFRFLGVQFIRSLMFKTKHPEKIITTTQRKTSPAPATKTTPEQQEQNNNRENQVIIEPINIMGSAFEEAGLDSDDFPAPAEMPEAIEPPLDEVTEADDLPTGHEPRLRTLYLMEHGQVLGKESERLVIRRESKIVKEIPAIKVDQIMVFGNAQITTQAMQFCLSERIPIYLLSARGRYYGAIDAFSTEPVLLHRDQFLRAADTAFCLNLARTFVHGKIINSRTILQRMARKREAPAFLEVSEKLKTVTKRLESAKTLDQLRGFEGSAARLYFSAFRETLDVKWKFNGRVRQPPIDPINALLSYGYTLLFYNIYTFLRARGLNPHVGYLHPLRAGHPALASDMIEEFRAIVVDNIVLQLVLNERLTPEDFQWSGQAGEPCLIGKKARTIFIKAVEAKLNSAIRHPVSNLQLDYRRCIEHQVNHLAAVIRGRETDYQAMVLR